MASKEQFAAWAVEGNGKSDATPEWMKSWAAQQGHGGGSPPKPRPKTGEHAPLLPPPMPQPQSFVPLKQPGPGSVPAGHMSLSQQLALSAAPKRGRHGRSHSEVPMMWTGQSDPAHPFNRSGSPAPSGAGPPARPPTSRRSSKNAPPPPPPPPAPQSVLSPPSFGSPKRKGNSHRRVKSDIPTLIGNRSVTGGRTITKADLLKNLPNPRWGGAKPSLHSRNMSRGGSDGPLLGTDSSVSSGFSGYGAISTAGISMHVTNNREHPLLQSIGSVDLAPDALRSSVRHARAMSDASVHSVTTDMAKSALFKGVTDTGRIQLQLPKDSFRLLMDRQLEAGQVYKRKLVDSEDDFFVEFHTVDDSASAGTACQCTCDRCNRCNEKQKHLPPDLYVMAVDSTIYRRMLDEVIASKTMPCGTFFCGHHEDVRHPDITIAALIVGLVFFLLLAGAVIIWD